MIPPTRVTPDWEEEGLLEGLDDEDARRGRIELLAELHACGVAVEELRATLDLVAAADAEGEAFPQIRAGVACGEAVNLGGDWFGRPVNLASRITDRARPGSVLVSEEVQAALAEAGFAFSDAGRKKLKGVRDQPRLFRVRTRETAGQGDGGRVLS